MLMVSYHMRSGSKLDGHYLPAEGLHARLSHHLPGSN